jgi:hypothetical protein
MLNCLLLKVEESNKVSIKINRILCQNHFGENGVDGLATLPET